MSLVRIHLSLAYVMLLDLSRNVSRQSVVERNPNTSGLIDPKSALFEFLT